MTLFSLLIILTALQNSVSSCSGRRLGAQQKIPMAERRCVVAHKVLVMVVMVVSASPNGQKVSERPGKVVARVRVNSLEQTQNNPADHGNQVHVTKVVGPQKRTANGTETSNSNFNGMRVLGGQSKRCGVLMVLLMNVLVKRAIV